MKRVLRDERGMALAVAIFALVVAGALIAGAFFAGTQEQRVGQNTLRVQQSFGVGEEGINEVTKNWNPAVLNSMKFYPADSFKFGDTTTTGGTGKYSGVIRRLNGQLYLVDITGHDRASVSGKALGAGARQRLGWLMRVRVLDLPIGGALTTQGSVKLAGATLVTGYDSLPTGWTPSLCDTTSDTVKAGIRMTSTGSVTINGAGKKVEGNPGVLKDPTLNNSTFTQFGDVTYDDLAASASIQLPAGNYQVAPTFTGSGLCDTSNPFNWGDGLNPSSACGSYWPMVHVSGDLVLNGIQGQGILLVDGNLSVGGGLTYYGIVMVRGTLNTGGGGTADAHFFGAVMAQNVDLNLNGIVGRATLAYSKCAITAALNNTGIVAPDRARGWTRLY